MRLAPIASKPVQKRMRWVLGRRDAARNSRWTMGRKIMIYQTPARCSLPLTWGNYSCQTFKEHREIAHPRSTQGCIKLGPVRAGVGVREVILALSGDQSNPPGLAAGSRWSFWDRGGNDHRKAASQGRVPRKGARPSSNELHSGPLAEAEKPVWHACRGAEHLLRRYAEVAVPQTRWNVPTNRSLEKGNGPPLLRRKTRLNAAVFAPNTLTDGRHQLLS